MNIEYVLITKIIKRDKELEEIQLESLEKLLRETEISIINMRNEIEVSKQKIREYKKLLETMV